MDTIITLGTIGLIITVIIALAAKSKADRDNNGYSDWEDDYYNDNKKH